MTTKFPIQQLGTKILMSRCVDHGKAFPDTRRQIPPDSSNYISKLSCEAGFSPKRATFKKKMFVFAAYGV